MANYKETTTVVNELIQAHNEREAGYKKASEWVENFHARELFLNYVKQSAIFIEELTPFGEEQEKNEINKNEIDNLFRGWTEVVMNNSKKDVKAIYAWCAIGEDETIKKFTEAFKEGLPIEIGHIIKKQFKELKESHGYIKALRDV